MEQSRAVSPEVFLLTHQRDEFRKALAESQLALSAANAKNAYKDQIIAELRDLVETKDPPEPPAPQPK